MSDSMREIFGEPISAYSRAQAIEDGVLVDLSDSDEAKEAGFKFPVAMTLAAYAETIEKGGHYELDPNDDDDEGETLILPAGQDVKGRLWDVMWMLKCAIKRSAGGSRVDFQVLVNDGKRTRTVSLYSVCGPGDNAEPVITIMLPDED